MIEMLYGLKSNDVDWDTAGQDKCFTGGATSHSMSGGMPTAEDDGPRVCAREAETVSDACSCPPSLVACLALRWNLLFAAEWLPVIRSGPFLGLLKARDQENAILRWPRNLKVAAHRRTCDFPVEGANDTWASHSKVALHRMTLTKCAKDKD